MECAVCILSQGIVLKCQYIGSSVDASHDQCTFMALALVTGNRKAQLLSEEVNHDILHSSSVSIFHFYRCKEGSTDYRLPVTNSYVAEYKRQLFSLCYIHCAISDNRKIFSLVSLFKKLSMMNFVAKFVSLF